MMKNQCPGTGKEIKEAISPMAGVCSVCESRVQFSSDLSFKKLTLPHMAPLHQENV